MKHVCRVVFVAVLLAIASPVTTAYACTAPDECLCAEVTVLGKKYEPCGLAGDKVRLG